MVVHIAPIERIENKVTALPRLVHSIGRQTSPREGKAVGGNPFGVIVLLMVHILHDIAATAVVVMPSDIGGIGKR